MEFDKIVVIAQGPNLNIDQIKKELEKTGLFYKILTDISVKEDPNVKMIRSNNLMQEAKNLNFDVLINMSSTDSPSEISNLLNQIKEGNSLVLACSRSAFFMQRLIREITNINIPDPNSQFKAMTKDLAEKTVSLSTPEQLIFASQTNQNVQNIRVASNSRETTSFIDIIRLMVDYKPLKYFGFPGLLLIAAGITLTLYSIYSARSTTIMVPSLFLVIAGLQLSLFSLSKDRSKPKIL